MRKFEIWFDGERANTHKADLEIEANVVVTDNHNNLIFKTASNGGEVVSVVKHWSVCREVK